MPEPKIKFQQQPGGPFFEGYEVGIKESTERWTEMKLWRVIRKRTYGATEVLFLSQSAIK
jgi:hypothetical protein